MSVFKKAERFIDEHLLSIFGVARIPPLRDLLEDFRAEAAAIEERLSAIEQRNSPLPDATGLSESLVAEIRSLIQEVTSTMNEKDAALLARMATDQKSVADAVTTLLSSVKTLSEGYTAQQATIAQLQEQLGVKTAEPDADTTAVSSALADIETHFPGVAAASTNSADAAATLTAGGTDISGAATTTVVDQTAAAGAGTTDQTAGAAAGAVGSADTTVAQAGDQPRA